jgi:uncharacterized membrane-anchored protein
MMLLSLLLSSFVKKTKKIIYAFCISLFICYVISATILNFYVSDFLIKERGLMRELTLVAILVIPSLLSTFLWWWFTKNKKSISKILLNEKDGFFFKQY